MTRPRVLYIAGTGRSGSTVVARHLETEYDAFHVGELRYVWSRGVDEDQLCECRRPFAACAFWSTVMDRGYPRGIGEARRRMTRLSPEVDRLRKVPRHYATARGWRDDPDLPEYAECVVPLYSHAQDLSGAATIIDSSKDPSYLFALRATGRIELRVVHLVRDPRAVAYSWTRAKRRPEVHWEKQLMQQLPPAVSARIWLAYHLAVEAYAGLGLVTRVRYEDFATHPDRVSAHIGSQCGLSPRPPGTATARHSFSGNPIRFQEGSLKVRRDDAWIRALNPRHRRTVSVISMPLLKRYGYSRW